MSGYGGSAGEGYYEGLDTSRQGPRRYLPVAVKYLLALVLLVVMDAFWMQLLAPKVLGIDYFDIVQNIQNAPIAWRWEGLLAYLVLGYAAAFMTQGPTPVGSAIKGAEIGFVIYAVFDFTTTFMFNGWGLKVAVCDTVWGTVMYSLIGYILALLATTAAWQRM